MADEGFEDQPPAPAAPPSGLADFVRENPIGAVIGAVIVGVLLGRLGIL